MKKFLQLALTFVFAFTVFSLFNVSALADEHVAEETTERKVIVHYLRFDGDYEDENNITLWTWGTGVDGQDRIGRTGYSDFGAMFEIPIADNADAEMGLIVRFDDGWGDGVNDRDGLRGEDGTGDILNKSVVLKVDDEFEGFDENGEKHVFVYPGSEDVVYQDETWGPLREGTGTLAVIFFDTDGYELDWDIWSWGGGTEGDVDETGLWEAPVSFTHEFGLQGMTVNDKMFRVAHFPIGLDADDEIGFIVRTADWANKKCGVDLFIDVTDIKGSGLKTVFYGGGCDFIETFEDLENLAMPATIEDANALDPQSILVEFNKGIRVRLDGEMIFDDAWFTVTDKDGNTVATENISFTQGQASVEEFMLQFSDANKLVAAKAPYTVTFQSDPDDEDTMTSFEVVIPTTAPTITISGSRNVELELGDRYSLPAFRAREFVSADEDRPLYDVRVKEGHGYLSTKVTGVYEIVIIAEDTFGNVQEETITITVIDPCDDTTAQGNGGETLLSVVYGTLTVLPLLAAGAVIAMRRKA